MQHSIKKVQKKFNISGPFLASKRKFYSIFFVYFRLKKRSFWWEKYESVRNPKNAWRWDIWIRISRQAYGRRGPRRHQKVVWESHNLWVICSLTSTVNIKFQVFKTIFIFFFSGWRRSFILGMRRSTYAKSKVWRKWIMSISSSWKRSFENETIYFSYLSIWKKIYINIWRVGIGEIFEKISFCNFFKIFKMVNHLTRRIFEISSNAIEKSVF